MRGDGTIDAAGADTALGVFEVDRRGLDKVDRYILEAIVHKFGGGPVGLSTLAIAVGEDPETVEDAYEPFLLMEGLLQRTPRGRVATANAYVHLGVDAPPDPARLPGLAARRLKSVGLALLAAPQTAHDGVGAPSVAGGPTALRRPGHFTAGREPS